MICIIVQNNNQTAFRVEARKKRTTLQQANNYAVIQKPDKNTLFH